MGQADGVGSRLVGRTAQCFRIDEIVDRARGGRAGVLWLVGEPGSGKTALCEYASRAEGCRVVRAVGVEDEAELALAGLLFVLRPLLVYAGKLAVAHQRSIASALGEADRRVEDRFALGAATLELLAVAAEDQPVVVVIDDAQWIDRPSADALSFACRRLDADAVAVILAGRDGPELFSLAGVADAMTVSALERGAAMTLLGEHGGADLSAPVAEGIWAGTAGLPLAMIEAVSRLDVDQRRGAAPLPDPLLVGARLLEVYRQQLDPLLPLCKLALGVVAAAGSAAELVAPALAVLHLQLDVLDPAETARVIGVRDGGWVFRHPLLRSAALDALGPAQRRRVHQAVAAVAADPERRAAHLAAGSAGPSVEVADALEAAALQTQRRAGVTAAANIWAQAARATPAGTARRRRLMSAGQALLLAGRITEAVPYLNEVVVTADDPIVRADAILARCQAQLWGTQARQAVETARHEARQVATVDPARAALMLVQAGFALTFRGEIASFLAITEDACELAGDSSVSLAVSLYRTIALTLAGRRREAAPLIDQDRLQLYLRQVEQVRLDDPLQTSLTFAAQALYWAERFDEARRLAETWVGAYRRELAPQGLSYQLGVLTEVLWWTGRWAEAASHGLEALALAEQTGQPMQAGFILALTARVLAGQGDEAGCRDMAGRALAAAEKYAAPPIHMYGLQALGLLELGLGHPEDSASALVALDQIREDVGLLDTTPVPYGGDLIEALARCGDHKRAHVALEYHLGRARQLDSPWTLATGLRGQALLAPTNQADQLFAAASDAYPTHTFEGARTQLCWAEHLRRNRAPARSRQLLEAAIATFDRLGARPWAQRARAELRAAGGHTPPPHTSSLACLSAQELQIALHVAQGMTNRQAASILFLSPKTIEHHLSRIYAKLQVASRSQLTRLVTNTQSHPPKVASTKVTASLRRRLIASQGLVLTSIRNHRWQSGIAEQN